MEKVIKAELARIAKRIDELALHSTAIADAAQACIATLRHGGKILFCGNGGSAADAQHLAAELVGRYKRNRPALAAIALTVDSSILTAIANDFGFDQVFARQVAALGKPGDLLYAISTSGNSPNILEAMKLAKRQGLTVLAVTGRTGGAMKPLADFALCVPADAANSVQELHIACGHLICDLIEQALVQGTDK